MARRYRANLRYSERQVREVIKSIGVEVRGETSGNILCLCPFHSNKHEPSFAISKLTGLYYCFNASCSGNKGGTLEWLVKLVTDGTDGEVARIIATNGIDSTPLSDLLDAEWAVKPEYSPVPQMLLNEYVFDLDSKGIDYLTSRGFSADTIEHFSCGWDSEHEQVVVPIWHHAENVCVGTNGRRIDRKEFRLSPSFPRNKFIFNLNNSKKYPTAILCESQFDVMLLHEYGYPNGICPMGSYVSSEQLALINRYHTKLIIMTDNDPAGRKLGKQVAEALPQLDVSWAVHSEGVVYPRDCKDVGDMTRDEARHCIKKAWSDWDYRSLDWFDN